uniref:DUF4806 domain-containing protein n=1 Tax=Daphnia galeata TaxID=27404 RepID=A0A8J2S2Y1_9CRUS|nr:unnamed protein product [Daphnia galeata]
MSSLQELETKVDRMEERLDARLDAMATTLNLIKNKLNIHAEDIQVEQETSSEVAAGSCETENIHAEGIQLEQETSSEVAGESCETEEVIGPLLPVQETSEVDETINVPTSRTISIPRTPGGAGTRPFTCLNNVSELQFPIMDTNSLAVVESTLSKKKHIITELAKIFSEKEIDIEHEFDAFIRVLMDLMLSKDFAKKMVFNVKGQSTKKPFRKSPLYSVVIGAAKLRFPHLETGGPTSDKHPHETKRKNIAADDVIRSCLCGSSSHQ